ncbi:sulfite oxidase [Thraustotheca clavata]|uniref:sulfite oxidase n=1 Tax=Thraustotheca clavata TaxID=74557 RepID=A0A1V9ZNQ2_9STRA|nr:sulfite oxidase [Thraustotheca clavata]
MKMRSLVRTNFLSRWNSVISKGHVPVALSTSLQDRFRVWDNKALFLAGLGLSAIGMTMLDDNMTQLESAPIENKEESNEVEIKITPGEFKADLPTYTLAQVNAHISAKTDGIWVVYKNGVYDITKFIAAHPGGTKILLASGKSIEPFWQIYAAHNHGDVHKILEGLRVGNLDPVDVKALEEERVKKFGAGPYANEPMRHPAMKINSNQPFNAEPPPELLMETFITPNDLFFIRNHLPVPDIDINQHKIEISGIGFGQDGISLSVEDLKTTFKQREVITTIQCAGNRRAEMSQIKQVNGLSWDTTALSTAKWTGVYLSDILAFYGIVDEDEVGIKHCHLEGLDRDITGQAYGASIPIATALDKRKEVLIAYAMNDEPIPRDHGYPLRAIVPGTVGARNVKFLGRIILSDEEYQGFWQQKDYRGFPPNVDYSTQDFHRFAGASIQELPVQSAITEPRTGQTWPLEGSEEVDVMTVKGYAWSGGGRNILRVDVSLDNGQTWQEATLAPEATAQRYGRAWAWTPWTLDIDIPDDIDHLDVVVKAIDSSYNVQPDTINPIWNMRGVLNNAWHRIHVPIQKPLREKDDDEDE